MDRKYHRKVKYGEIESLRASVRTPGSRFQAETWEQNKGQVVTEYVFRFHRDMFTMVIVCMN